MSGLGTLSGMTFIPTSEERERLNTLCEQIAKEKDQFKFLKLLQELNDLLDRNKQLRKNGDVPTKLNPA